MWIQAAILRGSGIVFSTLAVWIIGGLGITVAFRSSCKRVDKWNRKVSIVALEENDSGIDRLPDDILCDIVSRLRSSEAARSSILSKRWRKIWTMNPRLVLCCHTTLDKIKNYHDRIDFGNRRRFFKAVDQCLQLYSDSKLGIFSLRCCFLNEDTSHLAWWMQTLARLDETSHLARWMKALARLDETSRLARWMETLARLDVQEIHLGHSCVTFIGDPIDRAFTFSFKLINGLSRLKILNLMSCVVVTDFVSQSSSLVELYLTRIPLQSHNLPDILVSCPNLRDLYIERCELPQNVRISGSYLKLKSLMIDLCYNVQKLEISDLNATIITIDISSQVEILLSSVPKLGSMLLRTHRVNYRFGDVQRDLPQLKYLIIQPLYQMTRLPPTFHVFHNVRTLTLMTSGCHPYRDLEASEEVDLWNFAPVLSACPLLDKFYLEIGGPVCKQERMARWPVLRHKHLKHMELSGFSSTQNELEFAIYILTSAVVLKSFELRLSSRRNHGQDFYFEDVNGSKPIDTEMAETICSSLQGHALSKHVEVKLF